jgi:Flp pilus assembly protein TadG
MDLQMPDHPSPGGGVLIRLAKDRAGNVMAIMAIFLVPLLILAGSAVDMSRQYLVKVRLQQACDAGALAGRKFLTASSGTALDTNAGTQAAAFFTTNFLSSWLGATNVTFTPTRTSDNQVAATATATVPMTLMKVFNYPDTTLNVTCSARLDIADSDIIFVLDTTGSMACTTSDGTGGCSQSNVSYTRPDGTTGYKVTEKTNSKISGLRTAVLSFYDTLAAHAATTTHIRYGFVPYTSTVNVGYLLPSSYLADSHTYQSRQVAGDSNNGSSTNATYTSTSSSSCDALVGRSPATGYDATGRADVKTKSSWSSSNGGTCVITTQPVKPNWQYMAVSYDTSQYKLGSTVDDPSKISGATSKWQGCIEERATTASSSFNISSLPGDLDPDLVPTNYATQWRPMWPDVEYYRGSNMTSVTNSGSGTNPYGDTTNSGATSTYTSVNEVPSQSAGYVSCGKRAQRLAVMTRTDVSDYVNAADFVPIGGTYHDTGMIWGTRLLSPFGIFSADTTAWPGNNPPARYIVFMTDGDMAPNTNIYGMYGMEYYDKRVTGGTYSSDTDYHNARFLAECEAAKARNIVVYVVGFGQSLTSQLTSCASPGGAFYASDNTALSTAFSQIALSVAALRLSQ